MAKHIDREKLYTSLPDRIAYLQSFLDWTSRDVEALVAAAPYIESLIGPVVNIVYKKLLEYDITARTFRTRSTSYEGPMDDSPVEDSPQIEHRKRFLRAYLKRLCSGRFDADFWAYLDKVGMMHVGLGRSHPLHVEYIHLSACLSFIQDTMTEAILSHPRLPLQQKIAIVKGLGKVVWIQNDLFAKWHVGEGREFAVTDSEFIPEGEGVVRGKKALYGARDRQETVVPTTRCPFSGAVVNGEAKKETVDGGEKESVGEGAAPAAAAGQEGDKVEAVAAS